MATNGIHHDDLFDAMEPGAGSAASIVPEAAARPLLAIPCGFRNRRNAPCRRLGRRPVTIDSEPFHHRGHRIVHCDPACFLGEGSETNGGKPAANGRAGGEAGPVG